jgi:lipase ATG15
MDTNQTVRCHLGVSSIYDTMGKLGWSSDIRTHRIGVVIDVLLAKDWEEGLPVPRAVPEEDCMVGSVIISYGYPDMDLKECYSWEYGNFRNASTISPRSAC